MTSATDKQLSFIRTLLAERDLPEAQVSVMTPLLEGQTLTSREASSFISYALTCARKPQARPQATTSSSPWAQAFQAVAECEVSFYAIPEGFVRGAFPEVDMHGNDYLFLRVRNYQGKRYLSRVQGGPGDFVYSRFQNPRTVLTLANLIKGQHVEFAQNFHAQHGVCGRCAAPLTDKRSREAGFGPECRSILGV